MRFGILAGVLFLSCSTHSGMDAGGGGTGGGGGGAACTPLPSGFAGTFHLSDSLGQESFNLQFRTDNTYRAARVLCDSSGGIFDGTWTVGDGGLVTGRVSGQTALVIADGGDLLIDGPIYPGPAPGVRWKPGGVCARGCDAGFVPCVPERFDGGNGPSCP